MARNPPACADARHRWLPAARPLLVPCQAGVRASGRTLGAVDRGQGFKSRQVCQVWSIAGSLAAIALQSAAGPALSCRDSGPSDKRADSWPSRCMESHISATQVRARPSASCPSWSAAASPMNQFACAPGTTVKSLTSTSSVSEAPRAARGPSARLLSRLRDGPTWLGRDRW